MGLLLNGEVLPIFAQNKYTGRTNPTVVLRSYATLIFKTKSPSPKTMQAIYDLTREPEICQSQSCSFPRHGPDMGFCIHTLCTPATCANFTACMNNEHSLAEVNVNNLHIQDTEHKGKGLFAGDDGDGIGDFICTYSGDVAMTPTNPDKQKKSSYRMHFADRYVIEADQSRTVGKYIKHGCPGSANARTQIMISPKDIYMGVVAKRPILPDEEIVLDYCGACLMPPSIRTASLVEFGIDKCKCVSCERVDKACISKAERAPRACRSANSEASTSSASTKQSPRKATPPRQVTTPLVTDNDNSVSASSSSTTTIGQTTKATRTHPMTRKTEPPQHQKRLLSRPHPPYKHTMQAPQPSNPPPQDTPSMRGRQTEKGTTFLIPLVCLLPAQVAWNTDPDTYAAAKRIVINVQVSAEVRDPRGNHACMLALKPIGFSMHTNLVGSAVAFFAKAVKSLKSWKQTLAPGLIQGLAFKYNLPNLGDTILNLMHTTHLFKPKGRRAQDIPRDMDTFPPPEIALERSNAYGSDPNPNNTNDRNGTNSPPMEWPPLGRHRQSLQDHQGRDHNRHCWKAATGPGPI